LFKKSPAQIMCKEFLIYPIYHRKMKQEDDEGTSESFD